MVDVKIEPDGSTTFETPMNDTEEGGFAGEETGGEEGAFEQVAEKGLDPAVYFLIAVAVVVVLFLVYQRRKKQVEEEDDFFSNLDGEKFNLRLPAEVDEYYEIRAKCEKAGWEPGKGPPPGADKSAATGPQRVMAQALMKRAIADIPIVTHIQKESAGMNKLYSQSMCSVKQWRSYQNAEALVSQEVEEVRAEADEIEPGWSQVIWRQAMQYHNMLKQKHEMEAKAAAEAAKKRKEIEEKVNAERKKIDDAKARELAAEKAAQELIKQEEREKDSKGSFKSGGSMKKGFLEKKSKK